MQGKQVSDIETNLRKDWWETLFDQTYLLTDGDAVENPLLTSEEVDILLGVVAVNPDDRIVDLCCGQGRHVIELARRGFTNIAGRDGSAFLTGVAQSRSAAAGLNLLFETGDVRGAKPDTLGQAKLVTLLGNSFGYFEDPESDKEVLQAAYGLLAPEGFLYLDVADGDWLRANYSPASWEWVAEDKLVCRERKLSGDRLISREMLISTSTGVLADRTYAERLYTPDIVQASLRLVGFTKTWVEEIALASGGADPGMMGRRFVCMAQRD